MTNIGIIHPGAMGFAIARTMQNSGHTVNWASANRSTASRERASKLALDDAQTVDALCKSCDALVVVCPPDAAIAVAQQVAGCNFSGIYVDANAVAPQTMRQIAATFDASVSVVDGSIIGGPATERGRTWLYLSGEHADEAAAFFTDGPIECEVLDGPIGQASALKMCFAANSKGTNALQSAILASAEALGVRAALERQWTRYDDTMVNAMHGRVRRVAHHKAWRFAGEMDEIATTFAAVDVPNGFFSAAADLYRRMAHLKDSAETPPLDTILADVLRHSSAEA